MLPQTVSRARKLAIYVALLPLLATILFGLFSFILPRHPWTDWRLSSLIAAGGAVALLMAWPFREPTRAGMRDAVAAVLGLTAVVPALGATFLIAYGLGSQYADHQGSRQSLVYQLLDPVFLEDLLRFAAISALPGILGLWIARRRLREAGRISMAGMASRFSALGLGFSALIAAGAAVAVAHRWATWGL